MIRWSSLFPMNPRRQWVKLVAVALMAACPNTFPAWHLFRQIHFYRDERIINLAIIFNRILLSFPTKIMILLLMTIMSFSFVIKWIRRNELNMWQRVIGIDIAHAFAFPSEGFRNYGNTAIYEAWTTTFFCRLTVYRIAHSMISPSHEDNEVSTIITGNDTRFPVANQFALAFMVASPRRGR